MAIADAGAFGTEVALGAESESESESVPVEVEAGEGAVAGV